MITTHVESLRDVLPHLVPMFEQHWEELALNQDKVPLDPQYDIYLDRDDRGEVMCILLREAGEIVGYFVGFVAPGLHYQTCLTLTMDIFYVRPDDRCRMGGVRLFREVKREAKRRGVQRIFVGSKMHKDASRLFEALGYQEAERYYTMWVGD